MTPSTLESRLQEMKRQHLAAYAAACRAKHRQKLRAYQRQYVAKKRLAPFASTGLCLNCPRSFLREKHQATKHYCDTSCSDAARRVLLKAKKTV